QPVQGAEVLQEALVPLVGPGLVVPLGVVEEQVEDSDDPRVRGPGSWLLGRVLGHQAEEVPLGLRLVGLALGERDLLAADGDIPGVVELAVPRLRRLSHGATLQSKRPEGRFSPSPVRSGRGAFPCKNPCKTRAIPNWSKKKARRNLRCHRAFRQV